jgi:hypothetical protein
MTSPKKANFSKLKLGNIFSTLVTNCSFMIMKYMQCVYADEFNADKYVDKSYV